VQTAYDTAGGQVVEYCNGKDFEPRCHGNDVIMILSARYGRMKTGRCVKREPGFEPMLQDPRYLGCYTDVLHTLSALCSGKSECTLRVSHVKDQNDGAMPCYDNLIMYLEVAYICVSGMMDSFDSCWMHIFMFRCLLRSDCICYDLWVIGLQVFVRCIIKINGFDQGGLSWSIMQDVLGEHIRCKCPDSK